MLFDQNSSTDAQPRFVLLRHNMEPSNERSDHWDLMLEHEGLLVTYELTRLPSEPGPFEVRRLPDHRLHYLDFEGEIAGNRGHVVRLDRGCWQLVPKKAAYGSRPFQYQLNGARLTATISSERPLCTLPITESAQLQALRWYWED